MHRRLVFVITIIIFTILHCFVHCDATVNERMNE